MAKLLKLRRGTTTQHSSFTGAEGEVTIDTTKDTAVVHDGSQAGGRPLLREDVSNLADQAIQLNHLPHGTSSNNGKFLRANNGADPTFETVNTDLVADGTPQLGGNLDCNGNGIALDDSNTVNFGNNSDLSIYHDGSTTNVIKNNVAGRNLKIMSSDNGSLALFNNQAAVELYTNNVKKFETTSAGATVTGQLTVSGHSYLENISLTAGTPTVNFIDSGNNPDYMIQNQDGKLIFTDTTTSGNTNRIVINTDGHVDVTGNLDVGAGIDVTGTATATTFSGSGASLTNLPAANLTGTLPALDGSNLTGIAGIPSGVIAIWSGATNAIPSGWVICDGQNSTPDLRDRFVVGATASGDSPNTSFPGVSVGHTGGGFTGSMTVSVNGNTGWASQYSNASSNPNASPEPFNSRDRHQHGWGGNFTHSYDKTPPFYALAFIMKS